MKIRHVVRTGFAVLLVSLLTFAIVAVVDRRRITAPAGESG